MNRKHFQVSTATYARIMGFLDPPNSQKIAAIKALRSELKCGLKEAKEAIEKVQHEKFSGNYPHAAKVGKKIRVGPKIKKIVLDFGDEQEVEVDLEGMQMRVLMDMNEVGLDVARDILELVEALEAYSAGQKIGVL